MSDVKLFRLANGSAEELVGRPVNLEKKLQTLIEKHLDTFLHVRFVASEYSTGKTHAGRVDTLGLDENSCPTIIEYKRNSVQLDDGFSQDKRDVGHYGTGDLELTISNLDDLEKAKPLIQRSFEEN